MERISGHAIDQKHLDGCKPIALNISVYIDGYGAQISAAKLYDKGDDNLHKHMGTVAKGDAEKHKQIYDKLHIPHSPEIYAELISFCLALVELHVVAVMENRYRAAGTPIRPNALLVNQSNPLKIELGDREHNMLVAMHPVTEEEFLADHYLDVTCSGIIFSPMKIDRQYEIGRLKKELARARQRGETARIPWIEHNLKTIPNGVLHYFKRDGTIGAPVDFDSVERFYDAVSSRVGYYSRLGESKVHWGKNLSDFGEKGVDCDLIMQVMDDLHAGQVDAFVFMTTDMDFFPLVERIRAEGKAVFLCGLKGDVATRLIDAVGSDAFFDLSDPQILQALPSVFMAAGGKITREMVLQWTFLTMLRNRL